MKKPAPTPISFAKHLENFRARDVGGYEPNADYDEKLASIHQSDEKKAGAPLTLQRAKYLCELLSAAGYGPQARRADEPVPVSISSYIVEKELSVAIRF